VRCDELDDLIEAVAEGEPVPPDVEAHVSTCAGCRARVALAQAMDRLLRTREVPAPPEAFTLRVMRRVQQERWRVEQVVDAGFNLALAAGVLVVLGGTAGLLWSLGWFSIDLAALSAAAAVAPWAPRVVSQAQTLVLAAALLSSALALWWWVEGGGESAL
jgi:anti-sigma factor RsiW